MNLREQIFEDHLMQFGPSDGFDQIALVIYRMKADQSVSGPLVPGFSHVLNFRRAVGAF